MVQSCIVILKKNSNYWFKQGLNKGSSGPKKIPKLVLQREDF